MQQTLFCALHRLQSFLPLDSAVFSVLDYIRDLKFLKMVTLNKHRCCCIFLSNTAVWLHLTLGAI